MSRIAEAEILGEVSSQLFVAVRSCHLRNSFHRLRNPFLVLGYLVKKGACKRGEGGSRVPQDPPWLRPCHQHYIYHDDDDDDNDDYCCLKVSFFLSGLKAF